MKILVIGSSGSTGGAVIPELVKRGVIVRGLVHTEAGDKQARRQGASETAVADLSDVNALVAAADGVDGVFAFIPAFAKDEAGIGRHLVDAASRAGVRKVVFSSVYHPALALSNHRNKQPAEVALVESDLDFTILQPAIFMQQLEQLWASAQKSRTIAQPYSADARMSYVHYAEVAEVAAEAFVTERFSYGTFELAAPGMYSRHDLAQLMSNALDQPVTAQSPTFADWSEGMDLPTETRNGLEAMNADYDQHGFHGGNSLVLATMLSRDPLTVPAFIDQLARR